MGLHSDPPPCLQPLGFADQAYGVARHATWWLVAEKIGIDLWLTAAVGALMFLRFVGELASIGQEDQCLSLVARSKDEANSQNSD